MKKSKVEIVIRLDVDDNVDVSTSSRNIITNLGMLGVAKEVIKQLCGGSAKEVEEDRIIKPRF